VRLKIIAGSLGGRSIQAPTGRGTRPTAARVREAWMSALGPALEGATIVDLFAGSGALGIEALSRGARHVHFVESDRAALGTLRANLDRLDLTDHATVVPRDVFWMLESAGEHWDVALADPPYMGGDAVRLLGRFRKDPFATYLWIEYAARTGELGEKASWTRRYGDTRVSRFCAGAGASRDLKGD